MVEEISIMIYFRSDEAAPNLSDSLFLKIFEKNKFQNIEVLCHLLQKKINIMINLFSES